jgi:HEAT repeat protein
MNSIKYELPDPKIQETLRNLGLPDESKRLQARRSLEAEGKKAVLVLIEALKNGNWMARREAAIALATIKEPSSATALVAALKDQDHDVRWMVMKALIAFDQDGLEALLLGLTRDFDSVYLREGARHILKTLKHASCLESPMLDVLKALEGLEPASTVPWAAEAAWEELYGPGKKVKKSK